MTLGAYTIDEPVDEVPQQDMAPARRSDWSFAYRAAMRAHGRWVPVRFNDRATARNLAESAKKQRRPFEVELRDTTVFIRTRPPL